MRSMDPTSTLIYRWLYTYVNSKGKNYHRAIGPWTRKQHVNHGREGHGALWAELQQLCPTWTGKLEWITIKTVELKDANP